MDVGVCVGVGVQHMPTNAHSVHAASFAPLWSRISVSLSAVEIGGITGSAPLATAGPAPVATVPASLASAVAPVGPLIGEGPMVGVAPVLGAFPIIGAAPIMVAFSVTEAAAVVGGFACMPITQITRIILKRGSYLSIPDWCRVLHTV